MWPREAARNAGTLKDLMDDAPPEDGVYPVPKIAAWTLDLLGKLSDPDSTRPSVDECSMPQLMELVEGANFLDANRALEHIQRAIAQRLNSQRAHDLCVVLGARSDFDGAEERAEALAEPAFLPEGYEAPQQLGAASSSAPPAPLRQPSLSAVPATEDAKEAALALVDVATLCELKGVNRFWRALSRRVLCSRLCRGRGQPAPTHLEAITDLDVELLIEAGRPGETALAGRMLPGLARLHGYGFVVDVAKVRAANLGVQEASRRGHFGGGLFGGFGGAGAPNPFGGGPFGFGAAPPPPPSLLRGTAKAALDSCISGDGEAPLKLTIAAVACAGSGVVCGVPVQHMREDTVPPPQAPDDAGNGEDEVDALFKDEMERESVGTKDSGRGGSGGGSRGGGGRGGGGGGKGTPRAMTELNLCYEGLQGPVAMLISYLIPSMGALTRIDVRNNNIAGDGAEQLAATVLGNLKIEMFNEIPIKEMRADSLTELDLKEKHFGVEGGMVVAGLIPVMGALTVANLLRNELDAESAKMLAEVAKQKGISLCGIQRDQTTADFSSQNYKDLKPPDAILLASDLSQAVVTGGLTKISLARNKLGEEGTKAICEALKQNKTLKELKLSGYMGSNIGGAAGAKHVADMLGVNGELTIVE